MNNELEVSDWDLFKGSTKVLTYQKTTKNLRISSIQLTFHPRASRILSITEPLLLCSLSPSELKARPHYSCSCYSLYTVRVNIRILTRRNLASNWSSVDEDLRAQVKARRASRRAQAWRARIMWTHLYDSARGSYPCDTLFEFKLGHRLFWLRLFVVFLIPSSRMSG
jgi:hypothetical protein